MKPMHLRCLVLVIVLLTGLSVDAQYKVRFVVRLPEGHKAGEPVYLAGSFNRWNPGEEKMKLSASGGQSGITIELPKGMFEYKFTKGSWEKVEVSKDGGAVENRKVEVLSDTTIEAEIGHWADHLPRQSKRSTASPNVHIVDTAFYMPQLKRHRRIWIYLPPSYASSRKRYPVLYLHDAQNVFDEATSFSGEWGVDETMDSIGQSMPESIVVGIDNGGDKRMNEYSPFDMDRFGKGEGDLYVDFLVKTLRPYINQHYRTKRDEKYTFTAGSSMGGLIAFYAILKYPKKIGGAGVFSPAFWVAPRLKEIVASKGRKVKGKIYFFAGQQESEQMVPDMLSIFHQLDQVSKAKMTTVVRAEGKHTEATWRAEFPLFYQWLLE
jgi:predicted alpha/beta superfamily hydrolase